jgi:hypothetical protein
VFSFLSYSCVCCVLCSYRVNAGLAFAGVESLNCLCLNPAIFARHPSAPRRQARRCARSQRPTARTRVSSPHHLRNPQPSISAQLTSSSPFPDIKSPCLHPRPRKSRTIIPQSTPDRTAGFAKAQAHRRAQVQERLLQLSPSRHVALFCTSLCSLLYSSSLDILTSTRSFLRVTRNPQAAIRL